MNVLLGMMVKIVTTVPLDLWETTVMSVFLDTLVKIVDLVMKATMVTQIVKKVYVNAIIYENIFI